MYIRCIENKKKKKKKRKTNKSVKRSKAEAVLKIYYFT